MRILTYGSAKFDNYETFMRAMVVAIDYALKSHDTRIDVYSAGPYKVNQFTAEFVNRSENFLRQKGIKPRFYRVQKDDVAKRFDEYDPDVVVYLSTKSDRTEIFDTIISQAEKKDIPVNIYKI